MDTFTSECVIIEKASQDDFMEFKLAKTLSRQEGKCFVACVTEKFGIQKDGRINLDAGLKAIDPLKSEDSDVYNRVKQILEKCVVEVGDTEERCDAAGKFYDCVNKMVKE